MIFFPQKKVKCRGGRKKSRFSASFFGAFESIFFAMRVIPYGAAGGVTGSCFLVDNKKSKILIDCGIFQGFSTDPSANRIPAGIPVEKLDAVILTHAHLDHSGRLPLLVKAGFSKKIYATQATIEVAKLILLDSAHLQESDAERENRRRSRALKKLVEPLYTTEDVKRVFPLLSAVNYEETFEAAPGVKARLVEAGHLLGSASVELCINDVGVKKTILFSGDLGQPNIPILRDAKKITDSEFDAVFIESTYGDRDHRSLEATLNEFHDLLQQAIAKRGKVLIPTFAVGRAQQLLYHLGEFFKENKLPKIPIYLDSPMAIEASALYFKHTELYDEEAAEYAKTRALAAALSGLKICKTGEESRALNDIEGPCIIMAGAGMCNGGRILHHLKNNLWKPETTLLICGFQAEGSLGRLLAEGRKRVRIYGEEIGVRAKVYTLGGFSAHAGQTDLLRWLAPIAEKKAKRPRVVIVHGERRQREALSQKVFVRFGIRSTIPNLGEAVLL
ncbi:MAG: MBL fold metallo-hydrolase [Verrucomicrobia bacterium]|nr:MBL fold metallo-hydrolase [Verrucomicrobiota bacterium]